MIKTKQMVIRMRESFKYHEGSITVCQKMKKGFVRMSLVNVIAMRDQVLEEETRRDSIARKTVQAGFAI
ncbi:MAG: hypothetical protein OEW49_01060 [Nitrosopumilus sp.]|nr:hypothetical protein [Nitrosopumilus sp.]